MALDPLTALSVAGNIVQFTDFGIRLFKEGRELYASADGSLLHNREFGFIASDLKRLVDRIKDSNAFLSLDSPSVTESGIKDVARECEKLADILLGVLHGLKIQPEDKQRKWHTFHQAVKSIRNEKEINDMAKRLMNARQQLDTNILINVLNLHQSQLLNTLDVSTRGIIEMMVTNQVALKAAVVENTSRGNTVVRQEIVDAKAEIIDAIRLLDWREWNSQDDKSWEKANYQRMTSEQKKAAFKSYACQYLSYRAMTERLGDIPDVHRSTFLWIFETPVTGVGTWKDFSKWLSEDNGIYWIQGKPGSGKSCLMKYISSQEKTRDLLAEWSKDAPLIVASFFFWYPGTLLQKSQNGLLRSLLHQIISQQPLLTPIAFPQAWDRFSKDLGETLDLSRVELIQAVTRVLSQTVFELKTCLFIDGLDEYDGDHAQIAALFETVASSESTKVCIASRPWPVFRNSFANYPTLKLQDLTRDDIEKYIDQMLGESRHMATLKEEESEETALLIQDIAKKSSGVFLWVTLVVRSLLTGLLNNDHVSDLKRRLEELPSDLEELYIFMLKRIEPLYLEQAIRLFIIVQQAHRPLPSLAVSLVDDYDPSISPSSDITRMAEREVASRCRSIEGKIQSRCLGLLECVSRSYPSSMSTSSVDLSFLDDLMYVAGFGDLFVRVQYMHRTVVDFLEKRENWTELLSPLRSDDVFPGVHQALCFSSLVQLQRVFSPSRYGSWASTYKPFAALVGECLDYAFKVEAITKDPAVALLDELDRVATVHFSRAMKIAGVPWAKTWVHTILSNEPGAVTQQTMFLAMAIEHRLGRYVCQKILQLQMPLRSGEIQYLLNFSLRRDRIFPQILKTLLDAGADPNDDEEGATPWQKVLKRAWHVNSTPSSSNEEHQRWHDVLDCFICHDAASGASVQLKVSNSQETWKQSISAVTVVAVVGSARLLGILLDRGADLNQSNNALTPWLQCIAYVYQDLPKLLEDNPEQAKGMAHEWLDKFILLLEYGAEPRSHLTISPSNAGGSKLRNVSILIVINEVLSRWDVNRAADLQARLPQGLAVELRHIQSQALSEDTIVTPLSSPTHQLAGETSRLLSVEPAELAEDSKRHRKRHPMNKIFAVFKK